MRIVRNPEAAAQQHYDLIVVGGGIYGAMLALEASLRGCASLVLEKDDFGGATSYNSLRIIHGGLRDLQSLNLRRYWEFGRERRWFLEHFPDLVERLPVLVPLYQRGLFRTEVFRGAFLLDRILLPRRNRHVSGKRLIVPGKVISSTDVKARFPLVEERGLSGGALWYDAGIPDSQRLVMETLRRACSMGTTALNYMEATGLSTHQNRVTGVQARDERTGTYHEFPAGVVVNAAGPWCRDVARQFDRDVPDLYRYSMAWNILFDREAPSECALGIRSSTAGGQVHFLYPWKGRLLAGTGHAHRTTREEQPRPSAKEIRHHLNELNAAIPTLHLRRQDIVHVFTGYLPVTEEGGTHLVKKDRFVNHARQGGPAGLYSIGSTKLTAARCSAEKMLRQVFPERDVDPERLKHLRDLLSAGVASRGVYGYDWFPPGNDASWRDQLRQIIREESVCHLEDLLLRRTSLGDNPVRALRIAPELCRLFDWDEARCQEEVARVENHFR